nr:hypothetical protein [Tanacetum cinerariifolium]
MEATGIMWCADHNFYIYSADFVIEEEVPAHKIHSRPDAKCFTMIDKSLTCLGRSEKPFYIGLKKFVEHCKPLVNIFRNIKCPCKSRRNVSWVAIKNLSHHITHNGWDPSYKTWTHHSEANLPPPVIPNTTQPQMSDMVACLNDLSYIPPNNEQNEPTQGDIGETSNKLTQAMRNDFEELYANANKEL